jgi:hypothetical protein
MCSHLLGLIIHHGVHRKDKSQDKRGIVCFLLSCSRLRPVRSEKERGIVGKLNARRTHNEKKRCSFYTRKDVLS